MSINNRRSARIDTCLAVDWLRRGKATRVTAINVSREGMFLLTEEDVPPSGLLQVRVSLPDAEHMLYVVVRFAGLHRLGRGIGVEIMVASDVARRSWNRYYNELQHAFDISQRPSIDLEAAF